MRLSRILATTAALTLTGTIALADKFVGYGAVEGWNVHIDTEKGTCLVETKDDFDNVIQMGLTKDRAIGYIGIFTKAETNIRTDKKQDVALLIGENLYVGEATGMRGNITKGYSGGYVLTDNPAVYDDIRKARTMTVFPEEEYSFIVDLSGTAKALELAKKCNEEQLN